MKTLIIGAGASGLAAAYASAVCGSETLVLEKNEKAGKKIYITGKGRCNLTNACDFEVFVKQILHGDRFMYSALSRFGPEDIRSLLERFGCPCKTERGNRVFPVSDHASDVTRALVRACTEAGAILRFDTEVRQIRKTADGFLVKTKGKGKTEEISADRVIVCTGGLSYPSTGSTGDGYRFSEAFGHTVTDCYPSLVSVRTREPVSRLSGIHLRNVALRTKSPDFGSHGKTKNPVMVSEPGELNFTENGIGGPLILTASGYLAREIGKDELLFSIDLKPGLSEKELDQRILREFQRTPAGDISAVLSSLLISGIREEVLERTGIDLHQKAGDISREQRKKLVSVIKEFNFHVTASGGYPEAVITSGGITLSEIDPRTMESRKVPGLFFAGEVLDVDALTGGFNLQLAWSTGYAAGFLSD